MANSIKTDYMNTPNLGYSEYFIKNESDLNALSPKPGDRALVADSGAVYICIETGEWNKFGNSVPSEEVVIASEINENSTNNEVAGAAAVYAYGQQIKQEGGGGGGENVQSDWEQNDSTAPDYIKNRICYEEEGNTVTIEASEWLQGGEEWIFLGDHSLGLQIGDKPTVVIKKNGQEFKYICEPVQTAPDMPEGVLGTSAAVPEIQDTTEAGGNMMLYVFDNCLFDLETQEISVGDGFIFSLGGNRPPIAQLNLTTGGEIHQIPSKYIPPMKNYSTTEHVIGTWINGETLYEKTFVASIADSSDLEHIIEIENTEIDTCVGIDCSLIDNNKLVMGQGTITGSNGVIASVSAYYEHRTRPTTDQIYTEIVNEGAFAYPLTAYVTIRYIKSEGEG